MRIFTKVFALVVATCCQAGEVAYSSLERRLAKQSYEEQSVELANYQAPLVQPNLNAGEAESWSVPPEAADSMDCGDCVAVVQHNPWFAGVDTLLFRLRMHGPPNRWAEQTGNTSTTYSNNETHDLVRPYIGVESERGVGLRLQGWRFKQEIGLSGRALSNEFRDYLFWEQYYRAMGIADDRAGFRGEAFSINGDSYNFDLWTTDLDIYKVFHQGETRFAVGFGGKVAHYSLENYFDATTFTGYGASGLVELKHAVWRSGATEFALVGRGRAGVLTGSAEIHRTLIVDFDTVEDESLTTLELRLGLEARRHFRHADLVTQFAAETQRWETDQIGNFTP